MQIGWKGVAALCGALMVTAGCSREIARPSTWVGEPEGKVVPSMGNEVARNNMFLLDPGSESIAVQWMQDQERDLVALSDFPGKLMDEKATELPREGDVYLVRATSDDLVGVFEAYASEGKLLVLYAHLGSCGRPKQRVIGIRLNNRPVKVYAGCSGGL